MNGKAHEIPSTVLVFVLNKCATVSNTTKPLWPTADQWMVPGAPYTTPSYLQRRTPYPLQVCPTVAQIASAATEGSTQGGCKSLQT